MDPTAIPSTLVIQVTDLKGNPVPGFIAFVFRDNETIVDQKDQYKRPIEPNTNEYKVQYFNLKESSTRRASQFYTEGQVVESNLEPNISYRIEIHAEGFESQKRVVELQPDRNIEIFILARPGARYYWKRNVKVPFEPDEEYVYLLGGEMDVRLVNDFLDFIRNQKSFALSSELDIVVDEKSKKVLPVIRKKDSSNTFNPGIIRAKLKFIENRERRKEDLKNLNWALMERPEIGQLAIMIREGDRGATLYAGEVKLTLNIGLSEGELTSLSRQYGLKFLYSKGWQYFFKVLDGPDIDFYQLLDRICEERSEVSAAEPVLIEIPEKFTRVVPRDFLYGLQWDQHIIQLPEAWFDLQQNAGGVANQYGSNSIVIGVSDPDGVDTAHQDLSGNVNGLPKVVSSYDFFASGPLTGASIPNTHGTSCAGSATANADNISSTNPNFWEGTAGSAPGCRLIGTKLGADVGLMFRWYMSLYVGATTPQLTIPVDVASQSWGNGPVPLEDFEIIYLEFASDFGRLGRGIPICFAAGNRSGGGLISVENRLATSERVICVSASSINLAGKIESRAPYSCWGPENDVCAPSDNRPIMSNPDSSLVYPKHVPPIDYAAISTTIRHALAITKPVAVREGNLPGSPDPDTIAERLAAATAAGSPSLTLTNPNLPFTGLSALLVEDVSSPRSEGLQLVTVPATPPNNLVIRHSPTWGNTRQPHNAFVPVVGGTADYTDRFGGTSHAAPVTAGVIALMLTAKSTLSWIEVLSILRNTARKLNVGETGAGGTGPWLNPNLPAASNSVLDGTQTTVRPKNPAVSTTLVANVNAPSDPLRHRNFGTSILRVASVVGFAVGDAIHIRKGPIGEFRIVEAINTSTNELTIDALTNNYTTTGTPTTIIAGGVKPVFSHYYGFGRINAAKAVRAARIYNHRHRDLAIRNTLTDIGLVDIVTPAATHIKSPDIWIRNQADPVSPPPPYDQEGRHQNPSRGVDRYIYARIKNIGTHSSNLNAWVHFYVALSDHNAPPPDPIANPTNITTPFLFPGDFNSPTPAIVQKSWCDDVNNDISLPNPNGIRSNNQKVYHVKNTAAVPNQRINRASVAHADPNNVNTGVTVVRVKWNAADLPPVNTNFGIYLLVYVSPVDGERQGHEAGRNNNMSFREIAFAEFTLLDSFGQPGLLLPSSVNVDAFGTPVTTNFHMQVQVSIGSFLTELVEIEITRTNDNGSVERVFYRNRVGPWELQDASGNTGTINWATFYPPVIFGTSTAATFLQTNITFAGSFDCGMQHHKVSLKAIIHSTRTAPIGSPVPIAEESFDIMVIADVPETPSASATDPAPPIPQSFAFTDFANLNAQPTSNKSFGPIDSNHFRITSVFTAASAPKVYAVCPGVVMVQVVDATRVNLILRPLKQAGLGMTPVKYYIYRGLRKDDFFNAANTEVRPAAGAKEFIARIWPVFLAQNSGSPAFPATALGWDPASQPVTSKIDEYFFASGSNFQYALVKAGEHLADFFHTGGSEFGFEIVLEEGTAQPSIGNARLREYIIDISSMPDTSDIQRMSKRLAREEILNYLDPAAFYGMHYNGLVDHKPIGSWKGQEIVDNVVDKFFTKRSVYIDIRNENGNSYNFYQNYKGPVAQPDTGKNLKHGTATGSLTAVTYGTMDWPIQIVRLTAASTTNANPLIIQLRRDDNLNPVLYVEHGTITSPSINNRFVDHNHLFNQPPPHTQPWTNDISFTSPNTGPGPNRDSVCWLFKLHYSRRIDATTVWPNTVVKTEKTTDNLFGPIDLHVPWGPLTKTRWIAAQDRKYVDGQSLGFGQMMERGVAYEGDASSGRVIFYAALLDQHLNPIPRFTPRRGITGGVSDGVSFLQAARNFDQYRLRFSSVLDGNTPITTLKFVPGAVVNAGSANGIMFLGIAAAELTKLQALTTHMNVLYPRTIVLEEIGAVGNGKKYRLGVQGLAQDGTYLKLIPTPGNEVMVYSMEGLFFYSADFSVAEPLPSLYARNVEEAIGIMNLPMVGPVNYLINGITQGANGNFRVAGDLTQLISKGGKFQITGSPNNSGTYTVLSVNFAAASNITTLEVSNVPGTSTSGSLQLLPRTIEEHFISMDPYTVIDGTAAMKTIVDDFELQVKGVTNDPNSFAALQSRIDNFGIQVLRRARAAVRANSHANPDDRPLYWSRLKMMVILKSHPYLLQNVADAEKLVKQLDDRTRGFKQPPDFSGAGTKKKVLIIGFDPFFLVPGQPNHNSHQSNPSGVAALYLHGSTDIPNMFIQSVIVPVRFEDFDAGLIDNLVDPYLHGPNAVDMILSISQDIDLRFHVDRFCTRYRTKDTADNLGVSGKAAVHFELDATQTNLLPLASTVKLPRFLETTLPVSQMVPGKAMAIAAVDTQLVKTVIFDQKFILEGPPAQQQGVDNINTFSGTIPAPGAEVLSGSGGNYLSNELYFRIAWRRNQRSSTINTGHLHVPKLQQGTPPDLDSLFDPSRFKYYVDTVVQVLKDALPGI